MRFTRKIVFALALALLLVAPGALHASVETLSPTPLSESDTLRGVSAKPVKSGPTRVPTITWPGDVVTVYTEMEGIFKQEGLNVELFNENDFAKQVRGVIEGETPYLRGTMGMINAASEAAAKAGVELVVIYQLTWSNGGDVLVVRGSVKNLTDLKGKQIALQLYGPHMDFVTTALNRAGLSPSDVKLLWMRELTIPTFDTKGRIIDPRSAFAANPAIDGTMVISPDAAVLTSGGAEGVKGSKVLFSSKSANRVIADVYAVRADYLKSHRADVEKFVHALLVGQERLASLLANRAGNQTKFSQLMSKSADLLFGSPLAASEVEASLADCEWVDYNGNVAFFTGAGTIRNFTVLTSEIQTSFLTLGLMRSKTPLKSASWDYARLAAGLKNATPVASKKPAFDTAKTQQHVERQIATELETWEEEGSLYFFEIYFAPKQSTFSAAEFAAAFKKALELSQTFGGALITIEGHNSPDALNQAKKQGKSATEIAILEQAAKNLSYQRALAVRQAYLDYCKSAGVNVDSSQFVAVGMGTKNPKYPVPATESEWNQNRRVVFRVKAVETELDTFRPAEK